MCGVGLVFCTLLGPEGPGIPSIELIVVVNATPGLVVVSPGEAARGTARNLRTTQWTRAS
jgi:hypothetical protein